MNKSKILLTAGTVVTFSLSMAFGQNAETRRASDTGVRNQQQSQQSQVPQRTVPEIGLGQPGTEYRQSPGERQAVEPLTRAERLRQQDETESALTPSPALRRVDRELQLERAERTQQAGSDGSTSGREVKTGSAEDSRADNSDNGKDSREFGSRESRKMEGERGTGRLESDGPIYPRAGTDSDSDVMGRDDLEGQNMGNREMEERNSQNARRGQPEPVERNADINPIYSQPANPGTSQQSATQNDDRLAPAERSGMTDQTQPGLNEQGRSEMNRGSSRSYGKRSGAEVREPTLKSETTSESSGRTNSGQGVRNSEGNRTSDSSSQSNGTNGMIGTRGSSSGSSSSDDSSQSSGTSGTRGSSSGSSSSGSSSGSSGSGSSSGSSGSGSSGGSSGGS